MLLYSFFLLVFAADDTQGQRGFYRYPAICGETVVFTAEGDLWQVPISGGLARRLTTHPAQETHAAISEDGSTVAFSASYEGSPEVYVMALNGGLPKRLTYHGSAEVAGWTPAGEVLYVTDHFSTLPKKQLAAVDPTTGHSRLVPLIEASDGTFLPGTSALVFTRYPKQGSETKRYRGGRIQNLWRFDKQGSEAVPLTGDFNGTSKDPMHWQGRIYHLSDRDGIMNLWSINLDGSDRRQHTQLSDYDAKSATHSQGRIVYQSGADLYLYDIASMENRKLDIFLATDMEQLREKWVEDPWAYFTAAHLSPAGDKVAITARGRVFVAPTDAGRFVEVTNRFRHRNARFLGDAGTLVSLSDQSGEVEFWRLDAAGMKPPEQLTTGGTVLRFDGIPSADGKWLAFSDKNDILWLADATSGRRKQITKCEFGTPDHISWSHDSKWFAWMQPAPNSFAQVWIHNLESAQSLAVTTDRFNSYRPIWSPDGNWLYFFSDRNLVSQTRHPWGPYRPLPFLDKTAGIFMLALGDDLRSPFQEKDELFAETPTADRTTPLQTEGLRHRLYTVPIASGNYGFLEVNRSHLFYLDFGSDSADLMMLKTAPDAKPELLLQGVQSIEMSADGKKILALRDKAIHVFEAGSKPDPAKSKVVLDDWKFALDPREEFDQMFVDSWRLMRDYFYDRNMHGLDWPAILEKYRPFLSRVTDRAELSDLFAEMVGELSALHIFVRDGDLRQGSGQIEVAFLGARLAPDPAAGGYRITRIYRADPDLPDEQSPLARPGLGVSEGDTILAINGTALREGTHPGLLLRNQANKQVLLTVRNHNETKQVIVKPIDRKKARNLRYHDWEYGRRLYVEEQAKGEIGYVHLRAMGGGNYTEWARSYFPVFNRKGLIIDVRNNRGGNIDSWILTDLLRRRWMYWQGRTGKPYPNMQYAFGGHLVVLVNERTASDGEAFAEGFRRLGLGKVIGTRTWGGEIWLTSSNLLVDGGIASAAEFGVYGPEGEWLIEGWGVEPDLVVDNLPHAAYNGSDAQLDAAMAHLNKLVAEDPPNVPPPPPYPDKSFQPGGR